MVNLMSHSSVRYDARRSEQISFRSNYQAKRMLLKIMVRVKLKINGVYHHAAVVSLRMNANYMTICIGGSRKTVSDAAGAILPKRCLQIKKKKLLGFNFLKCIPEQSQTHFFPLKCVHFSFNARKTPNFHKFWTLRRVFASDAPPWIRQ